MALAVQMFVLLPTQWRRLSGSMSGGQHAVATGLLVLLTVGMLAFSKPLVVAYLAAILIISLLCPWLLVHLCAACPAPAAPTHAPTVRPPAARPPSRVALRSPLAFPASARPCTSPPADLFATRMLLPDE